MSMTSRNIRGNSARCRVACLAAANGADVYFTDAGGNVLSHEIDTWNPQGKSFAK